MSKRTISRPELDRQLERIARRAEQQRDLQERYGLRPAGVTGAGTPAGTGQRTSQASTKALGGASSGSRGRTNAARPDPFDFDDGTAAVKRQRRLAFALLFEVLASVGLSV